MELLKILEDAHMHLAEAPTGNFDLRDPEMDPNTAKAMAKAYDDHAKRVVQADKNWEKVAKALGGQLTVGKLSGVAGHPPYALVKNIKVEGSLKKAGIDHTSFGGSHQVLTFEPELDYRNHELVGVIKHVWKKATGGEQLYPHNFGSGGIDIGYFSSMTDEKWPKIVKGIQAVLEVLGER